MINKNNKQNTHTTTLSTITDFNLSVGCFGIDAEMVDPKMHEMVSDRSSRAENWTDLRKISMRVFFGSKKSRKKAKSNKKAEI